MNYTILAVILHLLLCLTLIYDLLKVLRKDSYKFIWLLRSIDLLALLGFIILTYRIIYQPDNGLSLVEAANNILTDSKLRILAFIPFCLRFAILDALLKVKKH